MGRRPFQPSFFLTTSFAEDSTSTSVEVGHCCTVANARYRGAVSKEPAKVLKPSPAERDEKVKIDLDPEEVLRVAWTKPKRNGLDVYAALTRL